MNDNNQDPLALDDIINARVSYECAPVEDSTEYEVYSITERDYINGSGFETSRLFIAFRSSKEEAQALVDQLTDSLVG